MTGDVEIELDQSLGSKPVNRDTLIKMLILTDGSIRERRQDIRKSFVSEALYNYRVNENFNHEDLKPIIKKLSDCRLPDDEIASVLDELASEGYVKHVSGFNYCLIKHKPMPLDEEITQDVWDEFVSYLETYYKGYQYDQYLDKNCRLVFDKVLFKLLLKFSISQITLKDQLDTLPFVDFKEEIRGVSLEYLQVGKSKRFTDIVYNFLYSKSPKLLDFIYDSYIGLINVDLIMREQELHEVNLVDKIKFLLVDTPFLVNLLAKTDQLHPISVAVANQCKKHKIALYYSNKTKDELVSFINKSKVEMSGLNVLKDKKGKTIKSQFVQDFSNQTDLTWSEYITMITNWESYLKLSWNITILPDSLNIDIDKDSYEYVKQTLPILDKFRNAERSKGGEHFTPRYRSEFQLDHDAYNIGLITSHRRINKKTDLEGPWYLSFDTLLSTMDAFASQKYEDRGYILQPRTLLNYLLTYSKIEYDEKDKAQVAEAILRYTIKSTDKNITIEKYTHIIANKLSLKNSDIKLLEELILSSPLRADLEKALKYDSGEADSIAFDIFTDKDFVEKIIMNRGTEEKLKNVSEKYQDAIKTIEIEREKNRTLQSIVHPNISIMNVNQVITLVDIDPTTQNRLSHLISLLEGEGAFKNGTLTPPRDISTKEKAKSWLESVKTSIETTATVGEAISTLLPLVNLVLTSIPK